MAVIEPIDIREFWLNAGEEAWYQQDDTFDQTIRDNFMGAWEQAQADGMQDWLKTADDALSYLILTDQFPRNMFRGDARSFATDSLALNAAADAIARDFDQQTEPPARQFFYLPFMHSEDISDQDRAIELYKMRSGEGDNIHAHAHRWVIETFGRFPYRNDALGRETTPDEQAFLEAGGYGEAMRIIQSRTAE